MQLSFEYTYSFFNIYQYFFTTGDISTELSKGRGDIHVLDISNSLHQK